MITHKGSQWDIFICFLLFFVSLYYLRTFDSQVYFEKEKNNKLLLQDVVSFAKSQQLPFSCMKRCSNRFELEAELQNLER